MELVNYLANGHLPTTLGLSSLLLNSMLCKSNGDLRPIAVGCTYLRLVAKVCLRPFIPRLHNLLLPSQVGVGTPLGCEAAVYATHYFMDQPHNDEVLLKLDVKMPSTAYAETLFFKKLKNTSQKSTPSYGTVILQKHPFFTETSVWIRPLVCNKATPRPSPLRPCHP